MSDQPPTDGITRSLSGINMSPDDQIAVSTDLWLAPIAETDRASIVRHLNDSEIARWMLRVPHPYGPDDFDVFLKIAETAKAEAGHPLHFTIHHVEHGPIGGFGFDNLVPGHSVELGYWLGREYWGQGFMTRVVEAGCRHAVATWQVVRISAWIFGGNRASAKVLEKCGFRCEGVQRCRFRKDGQFFDAVSYARIEE